MKAMILAAGKGTRMLPLTREIPKPLLLAGGKSLIQHQIEKLSACGFTELVINHSWLGEKIEQVLGTGEQLGVKIIWSREAEPLETAGGIIKALPLLGDAPFAVVNADIWTDYSFNALPEVNGRNRLAHLVLVANAPHHPDGDFSLNESLVVMPGTESSCTYTFSGIAVYHPDFFSGVTEKKYPLLPLIKRAIADNKVTGEYYEGVWEDIGTPARLADLDSKLKSN